MAKNKEEKIVNLKFVCPECGDTHLYYIEQLERGIPVISVPSDGNIEFDYEKSDDSDSDTVRFECQNCGYVIRKEGSISKNIPSDWLTEFSDIVEWLKKNCPQTPKLEDMKVIKLDTGGIVVTLVGWDGKKAKTGTIVSILHEVCSHCGDPKCKMDCKQTWKWLKKSNGSSSMRESMEEEIMNFREANFAVDTLESTILAHAIAGVDIESESYIDGINTAIDAIVNHS